MTKKAIHAAILALLFSLIAWGLSFSVHTGLFILLVMAFLAWPFYPLIETVTAYGIVIGVIGEWVYCFLIVSVWTKVVGGGRANSTNTNDSAKDSPPLP